MGMMDSLPKEVELHLIDVFKVVIDTVESKQGGITTRTRSGILSKIKTRITDFSEQGWSKEKLYKEKVKPYIDELIQKKQGRLLQSRTKKNQQIDLQVEPERKVESEGQKETEEIEPIDYDTSIEKPEDQDVRIIREAKKRAKAQKIKIDNVIISKKNKLDNLKKRYDEATTKIKERCMDETRQRHPLIQSIFRCLDNAEKFYNHALASLGQKEERSDAKAAKFFIDEIEKEIKEINASLKVDPELWIEPEYKSWIVQYHFFLDQINDLIGMKLKENDKEDMEV